MEQEKRLWSDGHPDTFEWPGRGIATRIPPHGMSDYIYGSGNAVYQTYCGARVFLTRSGFRAQYKNTTTGLKATREEAIRTLEIRLDPFFSSLPATEVLG
jgi:hypothetical protein